VQFLHFFSEDFDNVESSRSIKRFTVVFFSFESLMSWCYLGFLIVGLGRAK
jgi:hypothetical protein